MKKISRELQDRWEQRKALVSSAGYLRGDTESERRSRIKRARKNYNYFVRIYFPHLAKCQSAEFQIEAAEWILHHPDDWSAFEWPRGHAKTTHLCLLTPLWLMIQIFRQINMMVLVSKSQDAAIKLLQDIQAELEGNELFIADFGPQLKVGNWASGRFTTVQGCTFVAIGRGQSPRGLKNRGQRPDYICIDDIDDDVLVRNPARVKNTFEWMMSALMGTMAMGRGRFVMVGNRIGKDSVLTRYIARPGVHHVRIDALDKSGRPSWPENYSIDEIRRLRTTMGERMFAKEYMNDPQVEGSVFREKDIRYGKMLELRKYRSLVCYTDPSFKSGATNDYKATVLLGKTHEGVFHVLKVFAAQTTVSDMIGWHYDIHEWVAGRVPVRYWMESNFIQDLILDEFRKAGAACGMQIPLLGDKRKKPDKFARIEALQPLFERGLVVFNERERESPGMSVLVEQLLMFQKGSRAHDDAPDALEGAIFLLNRRNSSDASAYRCGERHNRHW